MPSTYSDLKLQLMATGENNTTWGDITNLNLEAVEEAIAGSASVTFASANVTLTLADVNTTQVARNLRLRCVGTTGGAPRNLVVPTIEKSYIVRNDCGDTITVKTSAGTGVAVPPSASMWVYVDGVNVVDVSTHMSGLTLSVALPVSSGGTGATAAPAARTNLGATTVGANLFTLANPSAVTFPRFNADNSVSALSAADFRTALGVGTVTSVQASGGTTGLTFTGGPITSSGTLTLGGTLAVANGGTGATTLTSGALLRGNGTGAVSASLFSESGSTMSLFGNLLFASGLPVLTFNSGGPTISSPAGNTLTVGTSGVERMRVTSTGNVGIGTSSPNALLDVAGAVRAGSLSQRVSNSSLILNGGQSLATDGASILLRGSADPFNSHGLELSTGGAEVVRIASSGHVGLGVTNPGYTLDLVGRDTTAGLGYAMRVRANPTANAASIQFTDNGVTQERGLIQCSNSGLSLRSSGARSLTFFTNGVQAGIFDTGQNLTVTQNITAFSDERLKTDIRTIDKALDKVRHMRGVLYTRKDSGTFGTGVIAQEMLTVMPEVVHTDGEYMSVAYGNLVGVLIEAVKELSDKVATLEARLP